MNADSRTYDPGTGIAAGGRAGAARAGRGSLPPAPRGLVARPRLLRRLDAAVAGPLTFVTGGAGFGKTSLLAAWAAKARRPVAWLALEPEDADAGRFAAAVAQALDPMLAGGSPATSALLGSLREPDAAALGRALAEDAGRLRGDLALVLDDTHHLAGGALDALDALLARLPARLHLVLAGREEPTLPAAGRLDLQGRVARIGEPSLRLTLAEADRLLGAAADHADPEAIAAALAALDGWPAGVRLLRLRLRDVDTPFTADPHATVAAIGERLAAEVLDREPPEVAAFLERICVLPRVTAPLADAMRDPGPVPSAELLAGLARRHLFVAPDDAAGRAYRIHSLLRRALAARVSARSGPEALADLHRRAAAWFASRGQVDAAIDHLLDAGDLDAAVGLLGRRGIEALARDDWRAVRKWLRRIPAGAVDGYPELLVLQAHIRRTEGDRSAAAASLAAAERLTALEPPGERREWLASEIDAVRCVTASFEHDPVGILPVAERLMAAAHASPMARSFGILAWAVAMQAAGEGPRARETVDRELAATPESGDCFRAYALLARIALAMGEPDAAHLPALAEVAARAGRMGHASRPHTWGLLMLAIVLRERDDLEGAAEAARHALDVGNGEYLAADLEATYTLASVLALRGDLSGARAAVEEIRRRTGAATSPYVREMIALAEARVNQLAGLPPDPAWLAGALPATALPPLRFAPQTAAVAAAVLLDRQPHRAGEALAAVDACLEVARARHAGWHVARLLPLRALAREATGDDAGAMEALREAFAVDDGIMVRRFLDLGAPMRRLLERAIALPAFDAAGVPDRLPARAGLMLGRFPRESAAMSVAMAKASGAAPLTAREREVLAGIARFLTNEEIAGELGIAEETVKQHASSVYRKLGVTDRRAAARAAAALAG